MRLNWHPSGRHFLQIPGPTNVPDRILRAMDYPTIDHRGPEFQALAKKVLRSVRQVFQTKQPVVDLSRLGHRRLGSGAGQHAVARRPGADVSRPATSPRCGRRSPTSSALKPEFIAGDWRRGADAGGDRGAPDGGHGPRDQGGVRRAQRDLDRRASATSAAVRRAIDAAKHPALLMVDTISSLGSIDYRHDEWGVDVTVAGSQKGLMLPPGLSFNAISEKALAAVEDARSCRVVTGAGTRCSRPTPTAGSRTRRRPTCSTAWARPRHAAGGGPRRRLRAPRPPCRGDAPRGARLGARDPVQPIPRPIPAR